MQRFSMNELKDMSESKTTAKAYINRNKKKNLGCIYEKRSDN